MGFHTVWLVYLGRRYGIVQSLSEKADTPRHLAKSLRLQGRAVETWCEAAAALGLLTRTAQGYALPQELRRFLTAEDDLEYLAGQFEYAAAMSLDYDHFDGLFRHGRALPALSRRRGTAAIEAATRWDHTAFLDVALPRWPHLRAHLVRGARVLDVGCGAGAWMVRTALRFPRSEFVGVDPDREALARARGPIGRNDLGGRVSTKLAEAEDLNSKTFFDIAYLGEVLSQVRDPVQVLRRVRRALKPRAHLVLLEGLRPARPSPGDAIVVALQLDQILQGSRFFTRAELSALLRRGGFRSAGPLDLGGGLWGITAVRGT